MKKFFLFFKTSFFLLCILLSLILLEGFLKDARAASQTVIINEVLYDPTSTDTGFEWIELYNLSAQPVNITAWTVQAAGTTFKTSATLSGEIQPESIFLICEPSVTGCDLTVAKLAFQNGGGATDGIQIVNSSNVVIDALFYDSPNSSNLTDENGIVVLDSKTAGTVSSGETLGRENSVDTDDNSDDFIKFTTPTPGQLNILEQEEPEEEEELEPTGANPLTTFLLFSAFILILSSARLINNPNFKKPTHGKS